MGGGEFWTGMTEKTTSDTDLKTSLAMRSSDTDFTEKFAKTDYGRELPGIYKKKDDTDLHIHFDVNVLVNEDSSAKIDPRIKVSNVWKPWISVSVDDPIPASNRILTVAKNNYVAFWSTALFSF